MSNMSNPILHAIQFAYSYVHFSDIIFALFGLVSFLFIHQKLTNKGPTLWPVLGMIPSFLGHYDEIHDWNTRALVKAGGTYRYSGLAGNGCHGIMTADPANIEFMLRTRFKNFPKGEYYRERFHELLGDGIFNADDENWREQRRIATSEMHTTRFMEYSLRTMQDLVYNKLLKVIEKQGTEKKSVDLQELLLRFTFDNVCVAAFGVDPGCLAEGLPEIPFAKAFEEATEYSLFRFLVPPFVWKTLRYFNIWKEKRLKEAVKIVHEFAETTVKNRKADLNFKPKDDHHCDLLSRLIKMQDFSDKFLQDFCISFILAGRDTSSVALAWFFWLLNKNPHVENNIFNEINEIIKRGQSENKKKDVTFMGEELEKMVYLHAALSESLRLYPSVPIDFKEVLEDDVYPNGTRVYKKERVFYHIYGVGRMESIWGKDCYEFKPERWIKDGKLISENQFKYLVFNAGPRLCVGKKFAYMQMKMVAASILWRYRVKPIEGQIVTPKLTTTLYMKNGWFVTFEPRG